MVQLVHRIDSLRQLGATALVDAAGVNPNIRVAIALRLIDKALQLLEPLLALPSGVARLPDILEEHLIFLPRMAEDGIRWGLSQVHQALELPGRRRVDQSHDYQRWKSRLRLAIGT